MENASKALMIAAEVLLGVLIISGAVYLFTQSGGFASNYYDSIQQQEIQSFNAQFEKYNIKPKDGTRYNNCRFNDFN